MNILEHIENYKANKDKYSLSYLLNHYSELINKISRFFHKKNFKFSYDDIHSYGVEGFIKSIASYNIEKNRNFEWYCSMWIKAYIRKYIMNNSTPCSLTSKEVRNAYYAFHKNDQDDKSHYELKNALSNTEFDENLFFSSTLNPEEILERKQFYELFQSKIDLVKNDINEFSKYILENRILSENPETLKSISQKYNFSNQTVLANEKKIINRIKNEMKEIIKNDGIPSSLH